MASVTTRPPARRDLVVPLGSLMIAVTALLLWWASSTATFIIPSPASTFSALLASFGDAGYWEHIRSTALASTLAFLLSIVVGTVFGLLLGLVPFVRHVFEPIAVALNGVPKIVLFPVLLLFFGIGITSKTVMGTMIGLFPVMMNVSAGIRSIPPVYRRLAHVLVASRWQTFWQVIIPAIRRPFMTGVRLAVSLSVVGVVLAEIFATRFGLGRVILARYGAGQYAGMLATVMLLLITSFVVTFVMWQLEKRVR